MCSQVAAKWQAGRSLPYGIHKLEAYATEYQGAYAPRSLGVLLRIPNSLFFFQVSLQFCRGDAIIQVGSPLVDSLRKNRFLNAYHQPCPFGTPYHAKMLTHCTCGLFTCFARFRHLCFGCGSECEAQSAWLRRSWSINQDCGAC